MFSTKNKLFKTLILIGDMCIVSAITFRPIKRSTKSLIFSSTFASTFNWLHICATMTCYSLKAPSFMISFVTLLFLLYNCTVCTYYSLFIFC